MSENQNATAISYNNGQVKDKSHFRNGNETPGSFNVGYLPKKRSAHN